MTSLAQNVTKEREFHFTDQDFHRIRQFIQEKTGISLSDAKKNLVYSRLTRRLRQLDIQKFSDYFDLVAQAGSEELGCFINAITTNLTAFFREEHHFDYLAKAILPNLIKASQQERKIRVWSAGCSTGEEPYSIAMTILETLPSLVGWDIKVLATDLDTNVVSHAKEGVYDLERIAGLSKARAQRWFQKGKGSHQGRVKVVQDVKNLITFKSLNLMEAWPMKGGFDVIFCRNVVIYFDKPTQRILFDRYADMLKPDSHLFVGHSESLFKVSSRFELLGKTIYRRCN